jgi:hypothetical protein
MQTENALKELQNSQINLALDVKTCVKTVEEQGKKVDRLNEHIFNGLTKTVKDLAKQMHDQVSFCQQMQDQKQAIEIQNLKAQIAEQKILIDSGAERRKSKWSKLPWWQKIAIITGILVFLLRPDMQSITKAIIEIFIGTDLGK